MEEQKTHSAKQLSDCPKSNWDELVNKIEAKRSDRYINLKDGIVPIVKGLIEELNDDATDALIARCKNKLEIGPQEDRKDWSQVYAAAAILYYLADGDSDRKEGGDKLIDSEDVLWTAAKSWGVGSFSTLGGQSSTDDGKYNLHKHCLDSIISALGTLSQDDPKTRVDRFFDSKISDYWKAFYLDSQNIWNNVEQNNYWDLKDKDGMLYRCDQNKVKYYELLAYLLENHQTEFARDPQKPKKAWKFLHNHADHIPKNQPLRQKIYTGLTIYLKKSQYSPGEEVKVFEDIFRILGHDAVSFILADRKLESEKAGQLLLLAPPFLETTWDRGSTEQEQILRALRAAIHHSDSQVQTQAMLFLKKHAPNEMQRQLEYLIDKLDTTVDQDVVGDRIGNLIEFGSEVALKTILKKCALWIARDENWTLVERVAQKIKMTPTAIQAGIYELSKGLDNREVLRKLYREKVIEKDGNQALKELFQTDSSNANAAKTPRERLNQLPPETQQDYLDDLDKWCRDLKRRSQVYAERLTTYEKTEMDSRKKPTALLELTEGLIELVSQDRLDIQELKVERWLTQLLSQMSDPRFYEAQDDKKTYEEIKKNLETFAIEPLRKRLPEEEDIEIREHIVKVLANVGGTAAIDCLVRTVTSKEREQEARQELLSEYYLKPSKERSEEASKLLEDAVENAKSTMRLLQRLNLATFVMGAILVLGGVVIAVYNDELGKRLTGILSTLGGLGGIVTIFLRDPLKRIQNAMGNLVQIQTAFTGFVWELNLNGTYIQSQYVANGILTDDDISQTVQRIDEVMDKTIHLIQVYTEDEYQVGSPNINYLLPTTGAIGTTLTLLGQNLRGEEKPRKSNKYQIAFNHKPVNVEVKAWTNSYIIIDLNQDLLKTLQRGDEPAVHSLWVSAMINGQETNSLLFNLTS